MLKVIFYRELCGEELVSPIGTINSFDTEEQTLALAKRSLEKDFHNAAGFQIQNDHDDVVAWGARSNA